MLKEIGEVMSWRSREASSKYLVRDYMTVSPYTIGPKATVSRALQEMRSQRIRHLPVLTGGKLVGLVSDRDLKVGAMFQGPGELLVEDVMKLDPFVVDSSESVMATVEKMHDLRMGSAVVQDVTGEVVGVFTAIDALRLLVDLLNPKNPLQLAYYKIKDRFSLAH